MIQEVQIFSIEALKSLPGHVTRRSADDVQQKQVRVEREGRHCGATGIFSWFRTVGPTDVQILHGSRLGPAWDNGLVAGNFNSGLLWLHRLNEARDGLVYTHAGLADLVDDRPSGTTEPVGTEAQELLWGRGFGASFASPFGVPPSTQFTSVSISPSDSDRSFL